MFSLTALALVIAPPAVDPTKPFDINDWTPRPAVGKAEPWERMKDPDWDDGRFLKTDTGQVFNCTFRYAAGGKQELAYKASVVRLGNGEGGFAFDRNTLRMVTAWTGAYLTHSPRRFALLNTPVPNGTPLFAMPAGPGWADAKGNTNAGVIRHTAPLPKEWAKYRGMYVHGDRVVFAYTVNGVEMLETAKLVSDGAKQGIVRTVRVGSGRESVAMVEGNRNEYLRPLPPGKDFTFHLGAPATTPADDLDALTKPGPRRWGEPLVTKLVRGSTDGPFAIDTLTIPYENPFHALFFCTGVDHLPDGRIAVSTCHGDVWTVRVDEPKAECHWQRFATGLYHPLGLKVIDGKVLVLERGQLTRLHDANADGEADFYENVNNDWHTGGGEHSYDTCLETDPAGNFYFFKTGDTDTPTGGCLMRVSKDGSKSEVFATGFRHPIGMGMSPTGVVTGGDQEGNWMPATRIDEYKQGGFYGDMRAHHRQVSPTIYDSPLCWLPREIDNSAGGDVWVPEKTFGPLGGLPLHLSYGRCRAFVLLRQTFPDGTVQGGVADLGLRFLSGSIRGRFHSDGTLYVVGLNGWQTAAKADGSLQRVRATGKPFDVPVGMTVVPQGVQLTFSRPLDRTAAADPANYKVAQWNYRWSGDYGSKRWKPSDPTKQGQDDVPVTAGELSADGRTVLVRVPGMAPVMQMQVGYNLAAADGAKVVGSVYLTVNKVK